MHRRFMLAAAALLIAPAAFAASVTIDYDVEEYENTCRPDFAGCTGCLTSGCDYDGSEHTEPRFHLSGVLVLLQGFAEATRCVICMRTGQWPPRLHDVQETETMLMHEQEDLQNSEMSRD